MNESLVQYGRAGDIALLGMAAPNNNALSEALVEALYDALTEFGADQNCRAAILYGVHGSFSEGADLAKLGTLYNSDAARLVVDLLNALAKPVMAVLSGAVRGGAVEIALACHERFALADATLSFPEIRRGLPPGAGATQHLPRLTDAATALIMLTDAVEIDAQRALGHGLVSAVLPNDDLSDAIDVTRNLLHAGYVALPIRNRPLYQAEQLSAALLAHRNGGELREGEAFDSIMACVEAAATQSYDDAYRFELENYQRCEISPVRASRNGRAICRDGAQWRAPGLDRALAAKLLDVVVVSPDALRGVAPSIDGTVKVWTESEFLAWEDTPSSVPKLYILDQPSSATLSKVRNTISARDWVAYRGGEVDFADLLRKSIDASRWIRVCLYGEYKHTILQPVLRENIAEDVLPTLVEGARKSGFVVLHGKGEALGLQILEDWSRAIVAMQHGAEQHCIPEIFLNYASVFERNGAGEIVLPASEPAVDAPEEERQRFFAACALTNTGCRFLDAQQMYHPEDIDLVTGFGYGFAFPAYGPMLWALKIGLNKVLTHLQHAQALYGDAFAPAELLSRHGAS